MKMSLMQIVVVVSTAISLASFGLDHPEPQSALSPYWSIFGGDDQQNLDEQQWEASVLVFMLGIFIAFGPHTSPTK